MRIFWGLLGLLCFFASARSQGKIFVRSASVNGKLFVRWIPSEPAVFYLIVQNRIKVELLNRGSKIVMEKLLEFPKKDDVRWQENPSFGLLYKIAYDPSLKSQKDLFRSSYGLLLKSFDLDTSLARFSAMFYQLDIPVSDYMVAIKVVDNSGKVLAAGYSDFHSTSESESFPVVKFSTVVQKDQTCNLSFPFLEFRTNYGAYTIEKSIDGKNFFRTNKLPLVPVVLNQAEKNQLFCYSDSLQTSDSVVFYRLCGLSYFGFSGPYSPVVKVFIIRKLEIQVTWDSLLANQYGEINGYYRIGGMEHFPTGLYAEIQKRKSDVGYSFISTNMVKSNALHFTDRVSGDAAYYRIKVFANGYDTIYSTENFVQVPDRLPPAIPKGFSGTCDSNGRVILKWNRNTEQDLKGYRLFKRNNEQEEWTEVKSAIVTDTIFIDTISINTLERKIQYSITGVDQHYNNSGYHPGITLKRPDKVAPVPSRITSFSVVNGKIQLQITFGSSADVAQLILMRLDSGKIVANKLNLHDTLVADSIIKPRRTYTYWLETIDSSGNKAISSPVQVYSGNYSGEMIIPVVHTSYIENKHSIKLEFENLPQAYRFLRIFRKRDDIEWVLIKSLPISESEFFDTKVEISHQYQYFLEVETDSGFLLHSKPSDPLTF